MYCFNAQLTYVIKHSQKLNYTLTLAKIQLLIVVTFNVTVFSSRFFDCLCSPGSIIP